MSAFTRKMHGKKTDLNVNKKIN
uniref:Uncharacterized protein n=1 Tax=Anguilla anguilla TaxID=7936 RepID=A0A0E9SQ99_ANGAN